MIKDNQEYVFTSESVSDGHPDKICDLISDALVDFYLAKDPQAKLAIETMVSKDLVVLAGEINSTANFTTSQREELVRDVIQEIGYEHEGFSYVTVPINDFIHSQSPDIARGVERADGQIGAGDQGMMIGYATAETEDYLPAPLYYSHRILESISADRKKGFLPKLGPDAKVQLSLRYTKDGPIGVDTIILSHQHEDGQSQDDVRAMVMPYIEAALPKGWMPPQDRIYINPTGRFVIGGPMSDSGLTGRKIIVDTYGSAASHGGGAFSGKDPTKVDRSGAYMARYLAKNIVASGLAKRCTLQIAYGIGMVQPVSFYVNLHGTGRVDEDAIESYIKSHFDLSPGGIIKCLNLRRPLYKRTAAYGHFGRQGSKASFPWENLDLVEQIKTYFAKQETGAKVKPQIGPLN